MASTDITSEAGRTVVEVIGKQVEELITGPPLSCNDAIALGADQTMPRGSLELTVNVMDDGPAAARQPGTLRWALAKADQAGGAWIGFDPHSMRNSVLHITNTLSLPSNTTIDAGCTSVTLESASDTTLLAIRNVSNASVRGISFRKTDYDPDSETARDIITVSGSFREISIEGNRFSRCGDGCIDVVRIQEGHLIISRNLFFGTNKTMLIGNIPCANTTSKTPCTRPPSPLYQEVGQVRGEIGVFGNVFWKTSQRHPKVIGGAFVHAEKNLIAFRRSHYRAGTLGAGYGMLATDGGILHASGNIIVDLDLRLSPSTGISGRTAADLSSGNGGFVRARGNFLLGSTTVAERFPEQVPEPIEPGPDALSSGWEAAAACILLRVRNNPCPPLQ
jgi:hypothetical protein